MGISKAELTNPKMAALLDEKGRKELGIRTSEETLAVAEAGEEKELQGQVEQYLNQKGAYYHKSPFSKRAQGRPGRADFVVCFKGYWLSLECKTVKGKQSEDQIYDQAEVERAGGIYRVVRSVADVVEIFKTL